MERSHASVIIVAAGLLLAGCSAQGLRWPLSRAPAVAPVPVGELVVEMAPDAPPQAVLQYWERNTLVLDLQEAAASGSAILVRREGRAWPARLGLRLPARRVGVVEVQGAQRVVLPVSRSEAGPVTVELPPATHDAATARVVVRWSAAGD